MTGTSLLEKFDYVYQYTRAQAIEDGELVDVTDFAKEAGFKFPVALTRTVFDKYADWNEKDNRRQTYQDVKGRLWDIFMMMKWQTKRIEANGLFEFLCIPRSENSKRQRPVKVILKVMVPAGDQGEPVITVMLPSED